MGKGNKIETAIIYYSYPGKTKALAEEKAELMESGKKRAVLLWGLLFGFFGGEAAVKLGYRKAPETVWFRGF